MVSFLDHDVLAFYGVAPETPVVQLNAATAVRFALLACGEFIVLPASSYFETPLAREIVQALPEFVDARWIRLLGRARDPGEFVSHKQGQYASDRERHPVYFEKEPDAIDALWIPKTTSTTRAIVSGFTEAIDLDDPLVREIIACAGNPRRLERALRRAPDALAGSAFISDFVAGFLAREAPRDFRDPSQRQALERLIAQDFLRSNLKDVHGTATTETGVIGDDLVPRGVRRLSLRTTRTLLSHLGLETFVTQAPSSDLFELRQSIEWPAVREFLALSAGRGGFTPREIQGLRSAAFGADRIEQARTLEGVRRLLERLNGVLEELEQDLAELVLERGGRGGVNFIGGLVRIGSLTVIEGDQINYRIEPRNADDPGGAEGLAS